MLFQTTLTESDILISNRSSVFDLQINQSKRNFYKDKQNYAFKIQISFDANNLDISVSNCLTRYVSQIDAIFIAINGSYKSVFLVVPEASIFPKLNSAQSVPRILQLHPYMNQHPARISIQGLTPRQKLINYFGKKRLFQIRQSWGAILISLQIRFCSHLWFKPLRQKRHFQSL